jgi:AraC-like DNA-binding protein
MARELAGRVARQPGPDPVVLAALASLQATPSTGVEVLSRSLALSERQLRRRFLANVGFGPRTFRGIARMRRFLALAPQRAVDELSLQRLALEAGYADQSHLTRESTRLLGMPPRAHLRDPRTWA